MLKIAGGLALIGAVVAEFVAGSGTATGLAWRIIEADEQPAARSPKCSSKPLVLLAGLGIAIFAALSAFEWAFAAAALARERPSNVRPERPCN